MKRGQVTPFIIIAIIIVISLGVFLLIQENILDLERIPPDVQPVHSFIESCVEQTANDAVIQIGRTGGYFLAPNLSIESDVAIYFDSKNLNQHYMPSKEIIKNELKLYMENMLFFCTKNFIDFPDFSVTQEEIETDVEIEENRVVFNINYPLSISKGDNTYKFNNFEKEVPVRLGLVHDIVFSIIEDQLGVNAFCVSCLEDKFFEEEVYLDMFDYDEEIVLFTLVDVKSEINGVYNFNYVIRYRK